MNYYININYYNIGLRLKNVLEKIVLLHFHII